MKATGNAGALQGLGSSVSAADSHQTRHLNLSEVNLAAPEGSQGLERNSQQLEGELVRGMNCGHLRCQQP